MLAAKSISIIIPAFNEGERISSTIKKVLAYIDGKFESFEIIVIDDGSTDNTNTVVASLRDRWENVKLITQPANRGKGASIKQGILSTASGLILTCDADLSTPIEEVEKLFPWMQKGFDVVIASRGLQNSAILQRQPWYRERMGKIFNIFVRTLVVSGIKDTQCGFKLFRGEAARRVYSKTRISRFCSDVEVLYLSKKLGYAIKEVPVRWVNHPNSKVRLITDSVNMLIDLLKIKVYAARGIYDE